jgi:FkbH-like protein
LDNTLWGGVIGDDGLQGIRVADGSAEASAFLAFQRYLLGLKSRGILLAVASKNDLAVAEQPFRELPEMLLKLDDFAAFEAHWNPKSESMTGIARRLNLGVDSLVFFDDNPAERWQVRLSCPDVLTPEVPADPAQYIRALESCLPFENIHLTQEDTQRAALYQGERKRESALAAYGNFEEYLQGLEMRALIRNFTPEDLTRVTQIINKTNQFNLTTRRYQESDVVRFMNSADHFTFTIRVKDRFGDHGLVGIVIATKASQPKTLVIDTWLMSCRVLKRGVEEFTLETLLSLAEAEGIERIEGTYIPTEKNGMVSRLYERFGFEIVDEAEGRTEWRLNRPFPKPKHFLIPQTEKEYFT